MTRIYTSIYTHILGDTPKIHPSLRASLFELVHRIRISATMFSNPAINSQSGTLVKFLASLWILVVRIVYAQLFTANIPLHYHVCDGLCLNLTQLFILVLIMIALTGLKIFIKYLLQALQRINAAALYKFNYWRYETFINSFCLRSFRYFFRRFPARHDQ